MAGESRHGENHAPTFEPLEPRLLLDGQGLGDGGGQGLAMQTGQIQGCKWHDLDSDGVWDDGEPPLADWRIYVDADCNGQWDAGEPYDLTDADGEYAITGVPAGTHVVAEELQNGWVQTFPGACGGAPSMLAINWYGPLYDVDPATGAAANPRDTGLAAPSGITMGADDLLYTVDLDTDELYTIDPVTGTATRIGPLGLARQVSEGDLDFDPTTGLLYGLQTLLSDVPRELFLIDPATGAATIVGAIPGTGRDMSAMAFDPAGNLYVLDALRNELLHVRKTDAGIISTVPLSDDLGGLSGMDFDPAASTLYVVNRMDVGGGWSDYLLTLDPLTGQVTIVGPIGLGSSWSGLEFVPGEPCGGLYFSQDGTPAGLYLLDTSTGAASHVGTSGVTGATVGLAPTNEPCLLYGSEPLSLLHIRTNGNGSLDVGGVENRGLAYDPATETLYGVASGSFRTIDPADGGVVTALAPPPADVEGIAFAHGGVYGIVGGGVDTNLYFYDPTADAWSVVGETGVDWQVAGLAYEPFVDLLYAKGGQDSLLYAIVPATGDTVAIGDTGIADGGGLAHVLVGPPGTYTIHVGPGETVTGKDFGNKALPGEIQGRKWEDQDADGEYDPGEPGVADWKIYIDENENAQWDAGEPFDLTDADGYYAIADVVVGTHIVAEVPRTGWVQTFPDPPGTWTVEVGPGLTVTGRDFGNWPEPGEIHGRKWRDLNGDGVWDAGEPALGDWKIYIDENGNGQWDTGEPYDMTDVNGYYSFTGLYYGTYVIGEEIPDGWGQTFPGDGILYFNEDNNFNGLYRIDTATGTATNLGISASIFSTVGLAPTDSIDTLYGSLPDQLLYIAVDGLQVTVVGGDTCEALAYDGVSDTLYATCDGSFWTVDPTNGSPISYLAAAPDDVEGIAFGNGGVYGLAGTGQNTNLYFYDPVGDSWAVLGDTGIAWENVGLAYDPLTDLLYAKGSQENLLYSIDSDPAAVTASVIGDTGIAAGGGLAFVTTPEPTHTVALDPGQIVTGKDFGNEALPSEIRGRKWEDQDADGEWDPDEPPLADWKIYIDENGSGQWEAGEPFDLTDADGNYALTDVPMGTHVVAEELPTGWVQTFPDPPGTWTVDVDAGQTIMGRDFGNWPEPCTILGTKWHDLDGNGEWDFESEPFLEGWKIYVDKNLNGQWDPDEPYDVTDEFGYYEITGLHYGAHVVAEEIQYGWRQTHPGEGVLYFNEDNNTNGLYTIDTATGVATNIGNSLSQGSTVGLAPTRTDDLLYGSRPNGLLHITSDGVLVTIVGGGTYEGLAYDWATDTLYGACNGSLWTVDPADGGVIDLLSPPPGDVEGIAFGNGGVYGLVGTGADRDLYFYDPGADSWSVVGDTGVAWANPGLAYDRYNDVLYAKGSQSGALVRIDPASADVTCVGGTGIAEGGGLAFLVDVLPCAQEVVVAPGETAGGVHFGNVEDPGEIHGRKFHDLDGDGDWQPGEPGLADWRVFLDEIPNGQWDPAEPFDMTNEFGYYSLTGLFAGTYVVAEELQAGWEQTLPADLPGVLTVEVHPGEAVSGADFGNWPEPCEITGRKWNDLNGDGDWDGDEPPLAGWRVFLDEDFDGLWDPWETCELTDQDGVYRFVVPPGEYVVADDVQYGWSQTYPAGPPAAPQTPAGAPLDAAAAAPSAWGALAGDAGVGPMGLPTSFDLRGGYVSSVKDQGNCGCCWAFASYGSLESSILVESGPERDFSENHLKETHGFAYAPCAGGEYRMTQAYLSRWDGPADEADDPYSDLPFAPAPGGPMQYYVRETWTFDTPQEIRNALMTCGGLYTRMIWDLQYYRAEDYTYYNPTGQGEPHAVTIVGWDDDKPTAADACGAWLIKNSWGTGWHDGGYFWVSYDDLEACQTAHSFRDAAPAAAVSTVYFHDEFGKVDELWRDTFYGITRAMNAFTANSDEPLAAVGFWTLSDNVTYGVQIYDTFDGTNLGGLLASVSGSFRYAGAHTVDLLSPVAMTPGDDFYVVLDVSDDGYAVDKYDPTYSPGSGASPGESYRYVGVMVEPGHFTWVWSDLTLWDPTANFCIKALTGVEADLPGTYAVELDSGDEAGGLDFGNHQLLGEIHGTKWLDLDRDGVRDDFEAPLPDWKVYIDDNENGQWDAGEPYDLTDADGHYAITGVPAGTHVVAEVRAWYWDQTFPLDPAGGVLYFSEDSNARGLYVLDPAMGAASPIGVSGVSTPTVGLALTGGVGLLYGSRSATLLHIDSGGSGALDVGGVANEGLACDAATGTLYGARDGGFWTIDPADGSILTTLAAPPGDVEGLAFGNSGVYGLVGHGGADANLYFYDPLMDIWSPVGNTGIDWEFVGLAYDPRANLLYATHNQDTALYSIDPTTAATSPVGDTGILRGGGLAFVLSPRAGTWTVHVGPGQVVADKDFGNFPNAEPDEVIDRRIFYNHSVWDGEDPSANAADDNAIAPNPDHASEPSLGKEALLPGATATFRNYTSYKRGINGIMIDIDGPVGSPTAEDFIFRVGNDSDPDNWPLAPAPSEIAVRWLGGPISPRRITIIWEDNAIQKQWLQVTVLPTADTRLAEPDVFYWGNAIGETGNDPANTYVNSADRLATRANPHNFFDPAAIDDAYDFDRDTNVNSADRLTCRANTTNFFTALKLITAPPAPPAVPTTSTGRSLPATPSGLRSGADPRAGLPARPAAAAGLEGTRHRLWAAIRPLPLAERRSPDRSAAPPPRLNAVPSPAPVPAVRWDSRPADPYTDEADPAGALPAADNLADVLLLAKVLPAPLAGGS